MLPVRPMNLAIVGGGPSAFYAASRLLSRLPSAAPHTHPIKVHIYDRLWAPHGLVRYGVAPDHPEVKNCTHKFDETAKDPRFKFFGNVNIGDPPPYPMSDVVQLPLSVLKDNYTHILFATGCTLPTLHPTIPPSAYCIPALSMVHWYTQHPSNPPPPPINRMRHVTIIGNGNVSLDIARMLLTSPSVLSTYDVPQPILETLAKSSLEHVSIVARRGPLEAAFTTKELRELINLPEAHMKPIDPSLLTPVAGTKVTRQQSRILDLLQKGSKNAPGSTRKSWSLDFFRSPIYLSNPLTEGDLAKLTLAHTTIDPSSGRAIETGEKSTVDTSLVVTSLGSEGEPLNPFYEPAFRHLRTMNGRLVTADGVVVQNAYASGWAATGAKGVLASTMMNAYDVADTIISDLHRPGDPTGVVNGQVLEIMNPRPSLDDIPKEVHSAIQRGSVVQYGDWKRIEEEEVKRGQLIGKERERMNWHEARAFLRP